MALARIGVGGRRVLEIRDFALAQPLRRVAAVLFGVITVLAVLGTLERLDAPLGLFDFDGEGKPVAAWSALVLLAAATASGLVATLASERERRGRWLLLGGFLAFMAVDEAVTLHETVAAAVGVDWQKLWAPPVAVGGVAWLLVVARLWPLGRERGLMLLGAAAWVASQFLERIQSNPIEGRVEGYGLLSGIEEVLEVTGSALFVLALVGALQTLHRRHAGAERSPAPI